MVSKLISDYDINLNTCSKYFECSCNPVRHNKDVTSTQKNDYDISNNRKGEEIFYTIHVMSLS